MKKILVCLGIGMIFLMMAGVLAEAPVLSEDLEELVKEAVEEKGVLIEEIESVEKVEFSDLPEQVDLESIDETNLAVYEVNDGTEKPFFVITVSPETFEGLVKEKVVYKMLLNFGVEESTDDSRFLESATGVTGSLEKGYVMMRKGSITGISTNVEILSGEGEVEFIIYRNKESVGFRNTLNAGLSGVKSDYDIQSEGVVTFESGDVISIYAKVTGDVIFKDATTLIEIATLE